MKNINWKIRFQNPMFIAQIIMSILVPLLSYVGLTVEDLTTWSKLFQLLAQAIMNPYCLALIAISVYNTVIDPTTKGIKDSQRVIDKEKL